MPSPSVLYKRATAPRQCALGEYRIEDTGQKQQRHRQPAHAGDKLHHVASVITRA